MGYASRWSDNERRFGPFLVSKAGSFKQTAFILSSGTDGESGCHLRVSLRGHTLIISLPGIIKPSEKWVDLAHHSWSSGGGYWDCHEREYGFSVYDGHFELNYGRSTHDSSTEQRWGCFLPWTQWRFVRHSLYDLAGQRFWTESYDKDFGSYREAKERCPSITFAFEDFDGEIIEATTLIEEGEWKFGEGWFKWLSIFRRANVRRSLDIQFSKETGRGKGSYKGGTIRHSITMLPGELHEAAFRRYCGEHEMTFVGVTP